MNYDFSLLKKYKIKPTKNKNGKIVMKDTRVLLKNVYDKKEKLKRKFKKFQTGGSQYNRLESELTEIENLHKNIKNILFLNQGIIEIYSNS